MKRTTRKLSGPSLDRFFRRFFRRQPGLDPAQADRLARISARTISSANVRIVALRALRGTESARQVSSNGRAPEQPPATPRTEGKAAQKDALASAVAPSQRSGPRTTAPTQAHTPPGANGQMTGGKVQPTGTATPQQPATHAGAQPSQPKPSAAKFDPYIFGLVPVYQRQGPEGLLARLADIERAEDLRAMAKAQQIVLPLELRSADTDIEHVRSGIVRAVRKRIADRRAAAG